MKEQRQGTLQQSQPNGSTTDKENLNSQIIVKEKCEELNIIENTLTGDIVVTMGNVMLKSYESVEEAKKDIAKRSWDLIARLAGTIAVLEVEEKINSKQSKNMNNAKQSTAHKDKIRYYTISMNIDVETGEIS